MIGNNGRNIYPGARLIIRVLYSILSAWVNLDSSKWRVCITLATLSVTSLQTNRQGVEKVTNQRVYQELVYRNKVFKTMLTGSPDLSFFPTRPHSSPARFFSPPLSESLEQAKYKSTSRPKHYINPLHRHLENSKKRPSLGTLRKQFKVVFRYSTNLKENEKRQGWSMY